METAPTGKVAATSSSYGGNRGWKPLLQGRSQLQAAPTGGIAVGNRSYIINPVETSINEYFVKFYTIFPLSINFRLFFQSSAASAFFAVMTAGVENVHNIIKIFIGIVEWFYITFEPVSERII